MHPCQCTQTYSHLLRAVRGPFVVRAYFKGDGAQSFTADGWFNTGDVASIDPHGYMKIVGMHPHVS